MAAKELSRNYATRYCLFYIDDESDIAKLPTSKESGKNEMCLSTTCSYGSIANAKNGNSYILDGNDEWVTYKKSSGSGGGAPEWGDTGSNQQGSMQWEEIT